MGVNVGGKGVFVTVGGRGVRVAVGVDVGVKVKKVAVGLGVKVIVAVKVGKVGVDVIVAVGGWQGECRGKGNRGGRRCADGLPIQSPEWPSGQRSNMLQRR